MMVFTAVYTGKEDDILKKDKCYNLHISNNSMIVYVEGNRIRKVYKSISDFLKDFNNVIVKN